MKTAKLLVCDLDNTLYDWVSYFVPAFSAMFEEVVRLTGWDREALYNDFRKVHQRYGDSEHPFSLLETEHVKNLFGGKPRLEIADYFDSAFHAFNSVRKKTLTLYPGVMETLENLKSNDVKIVAHTESKVFAVVDRLTRLDVLSYFDFIYCRERSPILHPRGAPQAPVSPDVFLKIKELSHHQRKPDSTVLLEICDEMGFRPEETAYVGDSVARDMLMAKQAEVYSIWAAFGAQHDRALYDTLVKISYWTEADIEREKKLSLAAKEVQPDFIINTFSEILYTDFFRSNMLRLHSA